VPNKRAQSRAAVSRPRSVRRVAGRGRDTGAIAGHLTPVERRHKTVTRTARACAARAGGRVRVRPQSGGKKRPSRQGKSSTGAVRLRQKYARRRADGNPPQEAVTSAAPERSIASGHLRATVGVAAATIVGASIVVITMTVLHATRGSISPVGHVDHSLMPSAPSSQVVPGMLGAAAGPTSGHGSTQCAGCASASTPGPVLPGGDLPSSGPAGPTPSGVASDVPPSLAGGGTNASSASGQSVAPLRPSSTARPTSASPSPSPTPTSAPTSSPPTTAPTTPATTSATTTPTTPTPTPTPTTPTPTPT
jgi:hypothetical protein